MGLIKKTFHFIGLVAQFLVLFGALNWGLMGMKNTDAIVVLFPPRFVRTVHIVVGVAALYLILLRFL